MGAPSILETVVKNARDQADIIDEHGRNSKIKDQKNKVKEEYKEVEKS